MRRSSVSLACLLTATLLSATPAQATDYDFELNYQGSNNAVAAGGSQLPTGTNLSVGDSFTYTLLAQPGMLWKANVAGDYFALFALATSDSARRVGDVQVVLSLAGQQVLNWSETDVQTAYVHVGANGAPISQGLRFDRLEFSYSLKSAAACTWDANECVDSGLTSATNLSSVLPIFGAPEFNSSTGFSYTTAVPEPGTAALTLLGLVPVGVAAISRRRRSQASTAS